MLGFLIFPHNLKTIYSNRWRARTRTHQQQPKAIPQRNFGKLSHLLGAQLNAEAVHQFFWIPGTFVVVQKLLLDQIFDCLVDGGNHLRQNTPLKTQPLRQTYVLNNALGNTHLHTVVGGELHQIILLCNLEEIAVESPLAKSAGSRMAHSRRARAHKNAPGLNF